MTMEELAITIKDCTAQCNAALAKGISGMSEYVECRKVLDNAVESYNGLWTNLQYQRFMEQPIPVIAAIKARTIDALSIQTKKNKDTGIVESVSYKTKKGEDKVVARDIDLVDFEEWAVESGFPRVTVNMQWRWVVEKFNYLMCVRAGIEIGGDSKGNRIRDTFKLSDDAKHADVVLNAGDRETVRTLQNIVDMIVFVDSGKKAKDGVTPINAIRVDVRDLKYIDKLMNTRKSSGVVSMSRPDTMRTLITDALSVKLNGASYEFDYEKETESAASMPGFTAAEAAAAATPDAA